jgi:hypothetical protein
MGRITRESFGSQNNPLIPKRGLKLNPGVIYHCHFWMLKIIKSATIWCTCFFYLDGGVEVQSSGAVPLHLLSEDAVVELGAVGVRQQLVHVEVGRAAVGERTRAVLATGRHGPVTHLQRICLYLI